jgi:Ribbon-helix-helix protein, copG family
MLRLGGDSLVRIKAMMDGFSSDDFIFDDTNGRYPEDVKARAPHGTRSRIKRAAEREGLSTSEIIRRAVSAYLDGLAGSREARA